jgi:hypothetical protein
LVTIIFIIIIALIQLKIKNISAWIFTISADFFQTPVKKTCGSLTKPHGNLKMVDALVARVDVLKKRLIPNLKLLV